jgi:hypothetical protein
MLKLGYIAAPKTPMTIIKAVKMDNSSLLMLSFRIVFYLLFLFGSGGMGGERGKPVKKTVRYHLFKKLELTN